MNKLEIGMYIRTKDGKIAKFIKYDEEDKEELVTDYYEYSTIWIKDVAKASHNIIDLIEEHDILLLFDKEYGENYKAEVVLDGSNFKVVVNYEQCVLLNLEYELITEEHIKLLSIVTKEQFEQITYKMGE